MAPLEIKELVIKAMAHEASAAELDELIDNIKNDEDGETTKRIQGILSDVETKELLPKDRDWWQQFAREIIETDKKIGSASELGIPHHKIRTLRTNWLRYAAVIIIILGVGAYLWNIQTKEKPSVTQKNPVPVQNDVAPGGNRATLTLADGSKIILDSAVNGKIAQQDNTTITKNGDQILYSSPVSRLPSSVYYNTMATPRGGQYQLTLPDGSQVWLNAESSITYPAAFNGKERKVSITGEAYFEVAKDKTKPFKVEIGTAEIEVLGTHFNVNTYKEEPTKNITLLEGSIRLTTHHSLTTDDSRLTKKNSEHTSLTLKPGQQGQLNPATRNLSLAVHPDLEQVMAWKNGRFLFSNSSIESIMNQVSRWYDVEIAYEGKIHGNFVVDISRDVPVSKLLQIMELTNRVHFTIERNKIIVKP